MKRDAGDIVDRWSIASLKVERIGGTDTLKELGMFDEGIEELKTLHPEYDWVVTVQYMRKINGYIWDLESGLRDAAFDEDLVEAGKRAILIRKFNSLRVGFKNIVNRLVNEGVQDAKKDHLSA